MNRLYEQYNTAQNVNDPVQYPRRFSRPEDIELTAFISALTAYGNVTQIRKTLEKVSMALSDRPFEHLLNAGGSQLSKDVQGLYHRFFSESDFLILFQTLQSVLRKRGSIKACFPEINSGSINIKNAIGGFQNTFLQTALKEFRYASPGLKFMFPLPDRGSACKRMNLYLRWMVRKDNVDFGLWETVPASKLIIPLDTHIARVGRMLKFTARKQPDWRMAEEITAALREYDPEDPVKYDFSLCHWGMDNRKK